MKSLNNKIISILLILIFVFSPVFANKAEAQWVTWDPGNFVPNWGKFIKEWGLDTLAWSMVNLIIERMAAQTVNWINSGFDGSPGFITDTGGFFRETADGVAGQYIFDNPNLNFLCGPISARIRLTLAQNYIRDDVRWQCTITRIVDNVENFMNDFSQGGWDGFFELTQRQQNNPIGAYMQADNELYWRIANRQGTLDRELNWGQGLMSWKECTKPGVATSRTLYNLDGSSYEVTEPGPCLEEKINTPGSVIQNKLNESLGMGTKRLEVADEINEIVSALMNQLTLQVIGGVGKGLRSLSSPGTGSTNTQTFAQRLASSTASETTDYFGNQQDTSVLDTPRPDLNESPTGRTLVYPPEPTDSGGTETCDPLFDPNCTP
jgi:hypothetical protein